MSHLPKQTDDGTALVSHSQMNTYQMCPKAYEYRYVEGIREALPGRVLVGFAFDKAINLINERLRDNKPADTDEAIEVGIAHLRDPEEEFDRTDIAGDDALEQKMTSAVNEYAATIAPDLNVADVQYEIDWNILPDVKVTGYVDLVQSLDDGLQITDVKSTMKKKSGKYTHDTAATDNQLTLYAAAIDSTTDKPVVARGWIVADIGRKSDGRIETVAVRDNDQSSTTALAITNTRAVIAQMETACETGLFPPYGKGTWKCSATYCEFWNRCPNGSKAQNVIPIGKF